MFTRKTRTKPAATRKTGVLALGLYLVGAALAGLWLLFYTAPRILTPAPSVGAEHHVVMVIFGLAVAFLPWGALAGVFISPKWQDRSILLTLPLGLGFLAWCWMAFTSVVFENGKRVFFPESFWLFLPPVLMFFAPVAWLLGKEYVKEHPLYRRFFVIGQGGDSRLGGVREFILKDYGKLSQDTNQSPLYIGETLWEHDIRIGRGEIGLLNDNHMMTVSDTGGGKSRDAIWNNLLAYRGGVVAFDPKGEHYRVTAKARKIAYVLDPYGAVSDLTASHYWNPLDEIDPSNPAARDQLQNITESSLPPEAEESANAKHFRENAQIILRGFVAHAITTLAPEQRHLGTVYDLIQTGTAGGKYYDPRAWEKLMLEMGMNTAVAGAARDAANLLQKTAERERSAYLSTVTKGIDWINSPPVREVITKRSTFSLRDAKRHGASIYLVLPEQFIPRQTRFLRTFYSLAFDVCDNFITPQPEGSERRVLFLFDEFNQLRYFEPAERAILTKRSSFIKCWFILQNLGQLHHFYRNPDNFTGSCDLQFFGLHKSDSKSLDLINKALGTYREKYLEGHEDEPRYAEQRRDVMTIAEVPEFLDRDKLNQLLIPKAGFPMQLKRVPYFKRFSKDSYGERFPAQQPVLRKDDPPRATTSAALPPTAPRVEPSPQPTPAAEPAADQAPLDIELHREIYANSLRDYGIDPATAPTYEQAAKLNPETPAITPANSPAQPPHESDHTRRAFTRWQNFGLEEGFTAAQLETVYYAHVGKIAPTLVDGFNADYETLLRGART